MAIVQTDFVRFANYKWQHLWMLSNFDLDLLGPFSRALGFDPMECYLMNNHPKIAFLDTSLYYTHCGLKHFLLSRSRGFIEISVSFSQVPGAPKDS